MNNVNAKIADKGGLRWPAPAKLNLMLRIVGRKPDGYHLLQTVFQFIDLCDYISFHLVDRPAICLKKSLPNLSDDQNLCLRAARLLQDESGYSHGVEIEIEKHLPMGAGLGGGSSDAATTLLALNELWGLHFSLGEIAKLGLKLGADVPVFVYGQAAWAEGVGEVLTPVEVPEPWYVVVKPDCHVSTSKIFTSPTLTRNNDPVTLEKFISGWIANDCLQVVVETHPQVKLAIDDLSRFGLARLTGTGACVFAAFKSELRARQVVASLAGRWHAFVTKGLNLSPLRELLSTAL